MVISVLYKSLLDLIANKIEKINVKLAKMQYKKCSKA